MIAAHGRLPPPRPQHPLCRPLRRIQLHLRNPRPDGQHGGRFNWPRLMPRNGTHRWKNHPRMNTFGGKFSIANARFAFRRSANANERRRITVRSGPHRPWEARVPSPFPNTMESWLSPPPRNADTANTPRRPHDPSICIIHNRRGDLLLHYSKHPPLL